MIIEAKLEGSCEDVAEKIFMTLIQPLQVQYAKASLDDAEQFAFSIAGLSIAGTLGGCRDLEMTKENLHGLIDDLYKIMLDTRMKQTLDPNVYS